MKISPWSLLLWTTAAIVALPASATAQKTPHLGYIFPAGGQQGTTFDAIIGGQYLNGIDQAYVTGEGVEVEILRHIKPLPVVQQNDLKQKLNELSKRVQQAKSNKKPPPQVDLTPFKEAAMKMGEEVHTLKEVLALRNKLFSNKKQLNPQLAESVRVKITLAAQAKPGKRELRMRTQLGMTHPLCFYVSALPEQRETEPNDKTGDPVAAATLPVIINGQILPGDIDRFTFAAKKGQRIVAAASARELIPYLADAVPGWFQATLGLYDAQGKEVAYVDDFRFKPDPALFFEVPKDGAYQLEIKDSIYRGREDFVYRIALGELPFITHIFPLGGKTGVANTIQIRGWNLTRQDHTFTPESEKFDAQFVTFKNTEIVSPALPFAIDRVGAASEIEPNDSPETAQKIFDAQIINGRIDQPGDIDMYRIEGRTGDRLVAETQARRLDSPVDSMLKLLDETGKQLEANDDFVDKSAGLATHHADSRILATLPADGTYYVRLNDTQHQGGEAYAYRLRIGTPQPDFDLRVVPCSINVAAGSTVPFTVFAVRKDGFDGDIALMLHDAPPGFKLSGAWLPAGQEKIDLTLTTPITGRTEPFALQLKGLANVDDKTITHFARPAEDRMQAFLYRHLVAAEDWLVTVKGKRKNAQTISPIGDALVQIDGTGKIKIKAAKWHIEAGLKFELKSPPEGITLKVLSEEKETVTLLVCADKEKVSAGLKGNLILEAFQEREQKTPQVLSTVHYSVGTLPAIRFEILGPRDAARL